MGASSTIQCASKTGFKTKCRWQSGADHAVQGISNSKNLKNRQRVNESTRKRTYWFVEDLQSTDKIDTENGEQITEKKTNQKNTENYWICDEILVLISHCEALMVCLKASMATGRSRDGDQTKQ